MFLYSFSRNPKMFSRGFSRKSKMFSRGFSRKSKMFSRGFSRKSKMFLYKTIPDTVSVSQAQCPGCQISSYMSTL